MKHTLFPTYMTKFKNQKKKHHFYFSKVVKFTNIVETKVAKCEHLKSLIIYTLAQIGFFHEEMWIKVSMFNWLYFIHPSSNTPTPPTTNQEDISTKTQISNLEIQNNVYRWTPRTNVPKAIHPNSKATTNH
jgi:hypothetical protein